MFWISGVDLHHPDRKSWVVHIMMSFLSPRWLLSVSTDIFHTLSHTAGLWIWMAGLFFLFFFTVVCSITSSQSPQSTEVCQQTLETLLYELIRVSARTLSNAAKCPPMRQTENIICIKERRKQRVLVGKHGCVSMSDIPAFPLTPAHLSVSDLWVVCKQGSHTRRIRMKVVCRSAADRLCPDTAAHPCLFKLSLLVLILSFQQLFGTGFVPMH